jgi:hypothetical protein
MVLKDALIHPAKARAHAVIGIQFYVNIDHISLGKQSIANKYAPKNTQNIGFIRENIELNTLYIIINVLIYSSLNMFSY